MAEDPTDDDACAIATEVALEKAMERCGSEEAVRRQIGEMMGLPVDEPDPDCEAALEEGLDESTLASSRGTRQWVMCRAWQVYKDGDATLRGAIQQAWAEVEEANAEGTNTSYSGP